jgi:hypothetical protein
MKALLTCGESLLDDSSWWQKAEEPIVNSLHKTLL